MKKYTLTWANPSDSKPKVLLTLDYQLNHKLAKLQEYHNDTIESYVLIVD